MKFKFNVKHHKRRGLSSIVGALIFVVLMVATFSVLGVALNSQTQIVDTNREVATMELDKRLQDFTVDAFTDNDELLTVNVNNLGENPIEVFSLVITNSTDFDDNVPSKVHDITGDASFVPPRSDSKNIVANTPMYLDLATDPNQPQIYQFKVISSLGRIQTDTVICTDTDCVTPVVTPGAGALSAVLYMDGPNGINTKNSTVVMFVTNVSDEIITDVQPAKGYPTPDCDDMWVVTNTPADPNLFTEDVSPCNLSADQPTPRTLNPHESTIFVWDGTIAGDVGAEFQFCNSVTGSDGGVTLPFVSSGADTCDYLTVIDPNDCGGCEGGGDGDEDLLDEKFITRPELFLTIPSPFGESPNGQPDRAIWGANVVNPTDTTMYIHKITITAFPPASNDNFDVVEPGGATGHLCAPQDISPGNGTVPAVGGGNAAAQRAEEAGFWSCPGSNTIMWRNYDNPITLGPQSTFPFMVKLAGKDPISKNAESVLVDSTVYTTSGSFGKGNYQSTAYDTGLYANIYQVKDDGFGNPMDPLNSDNWISSVSDIPSGSEQTFHVVLRDFDSNPGTFINATSKIVVNVPRAFTLVDTVTSNGTLWDKTTFPANPELWEPSITVHPDKTTQIIATIEENLGDEDGEYVTLSFKGTAPTILSGEKPKLMVMYTLANGLGTNNNSVGPLTEIILVVEPEP